MFLTVLDSTLEPDLRRLEWLIHFQSNRVNPRHKTFHRVEVDQFKTGDLTSLDKFRTYMRGHPKYKHHLCQETRPAPILLSWIGSQRYHPKKPYWIRYSQILFLINRNLWLWEKAFVFLTFHWETRAYKNCTVVTLFIAAAKLRSVWKITFMATELPRPWNQLSISHCSPVEAQIIEFRYGHSGNTP